MIVTGTRASSPPFGRGVDWLFVFVWGVAHLSAGVACTGPPTGPAPAKHGQRMAPTHAALGGELVDWGEGWVFASHAGLCIVVGSAGMHDAVASTEVKLLARLPPRVREDVNPPRRPPNDVVCHPSPVTALEHRSVKLRAKPR